MRLGRFHQATIGFEIIERHPAGGEALQGFGWRIGHPEAPGTGRYFGGINAIEVNADASYTGYADPRRTNAAVGY